MSGRPRGRARGRARAGAQQQSAEPPVGTSQPPQQYNGPAPGALTGVGRARPRGGASGGDAEVRPPADVSQVAQGMADLAVANMGAQGGAAAAARPDGEHRRSRMDRYIEPVTRKSGFDKRGKTGERITLLTNYFNVLRPAGYMIYQYHVNFSPEVPSKKVRQMMLKEHKELLGRTRAFDGFVLFLPHKLEQTVTDVFSIRRADSEKIKITITLNSEIPQNSPIFLHVMNIIFRRILAIMDMKEIGRHYYNPTQEVQIPAHNLKVWPGFITSILQYESSVMLLADVSHKVMRSRTVLDNMYELYERLGNSGKFYEVAKKEIVGEIVLTEYNNKTYRVDDIDFDASPNDSFERQNGTKETYMQYYQQHYGVTISDEKQPMLISNPKQSDIRRGQIKPIYLVPELCVLTGLTDDMRSNNNLMRDLSTHTRLSPGDRSKNISEFMNLMNKNEDVQAEVGGWNIGFDQRQLEFQGRVLPREIICMKNPKNTSIKEFQANQSADWSSQMRGSYMLRSVPLTSWLLICTKRDERLGQEFLNTLHRVGPPMGFNIGQPKLITLHSDSTLGYLSQIRENCKADTEMVVCLLPNNRKDRYDAIKKECCLQLGVPSQVVVARSLNRNTMSVVTKIAIQLNCKLGGEVWQVKIPISGMMVIGIDTYHDSQPLHGKKQSVAGFVASLNDGFTKYYSQSHHHPSTQELHQGLTVCVVGALKKYHQVNKGKLPTKVVVYRDGVGDGQLQQVIDCEVPQIKAAYAALGQDYTPATTFIVVKKRINTRLMERGRGSVPVNPPPGTLADTHITKPESFDFFLVSQSVRQGTVTPCHYNVILNESALLADHLQRLTYKLCHMYYNWPGTIRVPAPCQYAHKLAFLVGQSLHQQPKIELADKLYYL